jgi:hypothetical protein
MIKRNIRKIVSTFVCGIVLGLGTTAFAATYTSSIWGYYGPFVGYSYKNKADCADSTRVYASTTVSSQGTSSVPAGYMGAKASLYKNDALYEYTSMYYTTTAAVSTSVPTSGGTNAPSGTYYSKGITAAYNGNGYSTYYTYQSPSIIH